MLSLCVFQCSMVGFDRHLAIERVARHLFQVCCAEDRMQNYTSLNLGICTRMRYDRHLVKEHVGSHAVLRTAWRIHITKNGKMCKDAV